jgi:kumamolisin
MSDNINQKLCSKYLLKNHYDSLVKPFNNNEKLKPNLRSWFYADELASIYNVPTPNLTTRTYVAVVSFGGGLYGKLSSSGVLTNGDIQKYWQAIGISSSNMPTVIVIPINGARNRPNVNDNGATFENTIDVQQIGACCPSSNLTIILYIAPNSFAQFNSLVSYILNTTPYKPSVISISWGAPEIYYSSSLKTSMNNLFMSAVNQGINVCAATGDFGSNNGVGGTGSYVDFPASSPYVIACGGTKLICPNLTYDNSTTETAWSSGGGAVSTFFTKPTYQSSLTASMRSIPDIAMNADPNTGVLYMINNAYYIIGGTSIVSPTMAGFLLAIGENRRKNALPLMYNNKPAFRDILSGSNGAFNAGIGYDNCTGLGSIIGNLLNTAFGGVENINISVMSVTLTLRTLVIRFNNPYQLSVNVLPTNATNKSLTWSSSNSRIVSVSSSGLIVGRSIGTATITVRSVDGNKSSSIRITIRR